MQRRSAQGQYDEVHLVVDEENHGLHNAEPSRHGCANAAATFSAMFAMALCYRAMLCSPVLTRTYDTVLPRQQARTHFPVALSEQSVIELLYSTKLRDAVGNVTVQLGKSISALQADGMDWQTLLVSDVTLPLNEVKRLRAAGVQQFEKIVNHLLDTHTEAAKLLASVHLSSKSIAHVFTVLAALTDRQVLRVGMQAGTKCVSGTASHRDREVCLQEHVTAEMPNLRKVHEELLPANISAHMTARLRYQLLSLFRNGVFTASGDLEGWHAELEVSSRELQPAIRSLASHLFPVTSANWFTIGAPVASTLLGLLFWSLMDLLPGTGGFPTNRVANYALWALQGATTLGECLANAAYPRGVVYFASCIIDFMFVGIEVIWVFFDGRLSGLQSEDNCVFYSQWPSLQGLCGNCAALAPGHQFQHRCDVFCGRFNHRATFAASSSKGACFPQVQYAINEKIPGDVMLCQCVLEAGKTTSKLQHTTSRHDPFQHGQVQQNRRLQASQTCLHDYPYILHIIPSNHPQVDRRAPSVRLSLGGGQYTSYILPNNVLVDANEILQTRQLYLAQRPDRLELINQHTIYGYRRIYLIHGAEITTIIDSDTDVPPGNNALWVRSGRINTTDPNILEVPIRQVFVIAPVGNMSLKLTTTTTTTFPDGLLSFSVEVVTSDRSFSETKLDSDMTVSVVVTSVDERGSFSHRDVVILPAGMEMLPFECAVATFTADSRPSRIALRARGTGHEEWGVRAVYLIDDTGAIALQNSLKGLEFGATNRFWIGIPSDRVSDLIGYFDFPAAPCIHDDPYILQIVRSNRSLPNLTNLVPEMAVPGVRFRLGELFSTGLSILNPVFADSDEVVQTVPLFLPRRPTYLELTLFRDGPSGIAVLGYREIRLVHGAEVTSILNSANGLELGNNSFWIRHTESAPSDPNIRQVRTIQAFSIAPVGNASGLEPTKRILSLRNFRLEVVTSDNLQARTRWPSSQAVLAYLIIPDPAGGFRSVYGPINVQQTSNTLECEAASLFADERPVRITLESVQISVTSLDPDTEWGYRSVFFVDQMGPVALIDSFNGAPIGRNDFWIGQEPVRQRQTFQVPALACVHDHPYTLQILRSNHSLAAGDAPLAVFSFRGGQYTQFIRLKPLLPNANMTMQSNPLFLAQRPEQLQLTNTSSIYGYREIRLIHGAEVTIIITSDMDIPPGNNSFWIRNADFHLNNTNVSPRNFSSIPRRQTFTIPTVGNLSAISTMTRPMFPGDSKTFRLEIVTSSMPFAETRLGNNMTVSATFFMPDLAGGIRTKVVTLLPTGTETLPFECSSVRFSLDALPTSISIMAVGTGREQWGYRALYFFNEQAQPVALLDSINGATIGENEYWIGLGDNVISTQVFQLTTTSTTTTTFTSTTTMTAATTAMPGQAFQCPPYTVWPKILGVACGNCEALVPAAPYNGRCDRYCASFGLECAMARDDVNGTCSQSRQVSCNRPIPNAGVGMLCTCRTRDGALGQKGLSHSCSSYAEWPQINAKVCGSCAAVVPLGVPPFTSHSSCLQYCRSFQHMCAAAALQGSTSCSIRQSLTCSDTLPLEATEGLCTCLLVP